MKFLNDFCKLLVEFFWQNQYLFGSSDSLYTINLKKNVTNDVRKTLIKYRIKLLHFFLQKRALNVLL